MGEKEPGCFYAVVQAIRFYDFGACVLVMLPGKLTVCPTGSLI
jgi:hypothetical protein